MFQPIFILRSYVDGHMKKNLARGSCLSFASMSPKPGLFCFEKFSVELVLKLFSGRNSVEATAFGFSNSLPYDLEESREFRAWIS